MQGVNKTKSQTDVAFTVIAVLVASGILLLIIQSLDQVSWTAAWRYLFIGGMAGIAGLGCGGLVGLIFGLPESRQVVVTSQSVPIASESPLAPVSAASDWYQDSSSLERIATWLTGAIIALSLANFDSWTARFDHVAMSIGLAMQGSTAEELTAASNRAAKAQTALKSMKIEAGEPNEAYEKRVAVAVEAARSTQAEAIRATSEAEVPGGLLLGGYAFLGFAVSGGENPRIDGAVGMGPRRLAAGIALSRARVGNLSWIFCRVRSVSIGGNGFSC